MSIKDEKNSGTDGQVASEPSPVEIARKSLLNEFNVGFLGRLRIKIAVRAVEHLIEAKVNEIVDARVHAALEAYKAENR